MITTTALEGACENEREQMNEKLLNTMLQLSLVKAPSADVAGRIVGGARRWLKPKEKPACAADCSRL